MSATHDGKGFVRVAGTLALLAGAAGALVGACGGDQLPANGLLVRISSDEPDQVHVVVIELYEGDTRVFRNVETVGTGMNEVTLPASLAIEPPTSNPRAVLTIVGYVGDEKRNILGKAVAETTIPDNRVAVLDLSVDVVCIQSKETTGTIGDKDTISQSRCAMGQTCKEGQCVSDAVDSSGLPDYGADGGDRMSTLDATTPADSSVDSSVDSTIDVGIDSGVDSAGTGDDAADSSRADSSDSSTTADSSDGSTIADSSDSSTTADSADGHTVGLTVFPKNDPSAVLLLELNGDLLDSSGNSRNATAIGTPSFVPSKFGSGLVLGGDPQGFDLSAFAPFVNGNVTVEVVYTSINVIGATVLKIFGSNDATDDGWYQSNNAFLSSPGGSPLGTLASNTLHYLALIPTSATTMEVWIDGSLAGSTPVNISFPPSQAIFFRDDSSTSRAQTMLGVVDAVRISSVARTSTEIAAVWANVNQ